MSAKTLITLLFLLLLLSPGPVCLAQKSSEEPIENELSQSENDTLSARDLKAEKKKKNVVMLDDKFFISLALDFATIFVLIILVYYPNTKKMDYIFTFVIFNLMIFLITFVLKYVKLSMGAAFGLFAVFSMLRYRTAGISIRDMTYLFIFIAIGLLSAIQLDYYKLAILDGLIFVVTFVLDGNFIIRREQSKTIRYENIEMIRPERKEELIEDLKKRTGLNIRRITIGRIDFLKDMANVKIFYYE
ncbi:MAG: DUF4956 domain-containing protein [Bacteroidota bacterium]